MCYTEIYEVITVKKFLTLVLISLSLFLFTGCQKDYEEDYMKEINYEEYKNLIANKETFILEIMRTDCTACISFKPKITQVANDYKIEVKYINTDHISEKEEDELFEVTGINGTPTVIFYHDGIEKTVASRINGSVSIDKIISKFKASEFIEE